MFCIRELFCQPMWPINWIPWCWNDCVNWHIEWSVHTLFENVQCEFRNCLLLDAVHIEYAADPPNWTGKVHFFLCDKDILRNGKLYAFKHNYWNAETIRLRSSKPKMETQQFSQKRLTTHISRLCSSFAEILMQYSDWVTAFSHDKKSTTHPINV